MAEQDNSSTTASGAEDHYEVDPRKLLALHPRDAEIIFTSQSSYGSSLTADFRENVKALNQVYSAVQRYLQGIYRRPDVFYPQLQDIFKDLQMHKRAISDKIPMPTEEQLQKQCINLAAQNPPFIHVLRELSVSGNNSFMFVSLYVAPTEKHDDKVIVGYRSTIENSMKVLRDRVRRGELGIDYALAFGRVSAASELPVTFGRVDTEMKKIYINEKSFSSITQADLAHLRRVNQEIYKRLYKPLLLQGIKERIFLSISCEDIRKLDFAGSDRVFDIVLFNNAEAIKDRFAALANFLKAGAVGDYWDAASAAALETRLKAHEIDDVQFRVELARAIFKKLSAAADPPPALVLLTVEIMKVGDWMHSHRKDEVKSAEQNEHKYLLERLRKTGLLRYRGSKNFEISEKLLRLILRGRVPAVLGCTEPYATPESILDSTDLHSFENIYLILKDRRLTAKAVDTAVELFEKTEDTHLLHVLENLFGLATRNDNEMKEYIAPAYLDRLRFCLRRAYQKHLPWWTRLYLFLTSSELSEKKVQQIRTEKRQAHSRQSQRRKETADAESRKQAQAEVKKLARNRIQERDSEGAQDADAGGQLGDAESKLLADMLNYLAKEWTHGRYPDRDALAGKFSGRGAAYQKIMGLLDVGAASVGDILKIPIGYNHVYGSREFIKEHRAELLQYFNEQLNNEAVIIHENRAMTLKDDSQKKEIYRALYDYIRYRVKSE